MSNRTRRLVRLRREIAEVETGLRRQMKVLE